MRRRLLTRGSSAVPPGGMDNARCPRCAYDLRGVMSSWRTTCPLWGVCVECGLEFRWTEILREKIPPRWCVESPVFRYTDRLRAPLQTLVRTFWPWRFWGSLKMSHEIRWRAIGGYLLGEGLAVYIVFCLAHGALAWAVLTGGGAGVFGFIPRPALTFHWADIALPILLPLADWPLGSTNLSPRDLFKLFWLPLLPAAAFLLSVHVLCAAGFFTLPVSRKIAKVRWGHINRATLYGLGLFVPLACAFPPGVALVQNPNSSFSIAGRVLLLVAGVLALLLIPMEMAWWSTATGRYMRIPHAWGVGASVVVMSLGATVLAMFAVMLIWMPSR